MSERFFILACFVIFATGQANAAAVKNLQPLWSTVGNHFAPKENHNFLFFKPVKNEILLEKYIKELSMNYSLAESNKIKSILNDWLDSLSGIDQTIECTACASGVSTYRSLTDMGFNHDRLLPLATKICIDFNIMTHDICTGIVEAYGRVLLNIFDLASNKTSRDICTYLLNTDCGGNEFQWAVKLPPTKKPPLQKPEPSSDPSSLLKVLHITDTHWDTKYVEGTWAECKEPLCCRAGQKPPNENAALAGKYGGWKCDIPEVTFDDMLAHAGKQHVKFDYILWTGDIPAHDIWSQNKSDNVDILRKTVDKIRKAFPRTLIIPALGNHESVPPNLFPVARLNDTQNPMNWLYDELYKEWEMWLPGHSEKTVKKGAFFTYLLRPGLRVVSMNMNYCYSLNWWLVVDSEDPTNQLQWLVEVLQEAENNKERVHILGHIPPGNSDCLKVWRTNYYRIINRYENTVTAQFFGHTHSEKFELVYDENDNNRPVAVSYVAPSVTTYTYLNPAYRVYHVEGSNTSRNFVVDHETWYLDLEKANREKKTEWKKLYSAKADLNMTNLYPQDWMKVYDSLANSDQFLELYNKFRWSDSPKRGVCDDQCRREILCEIRSCQQYGPPPGKTL